jgi:hypothetical protein
MHWMSVKLPDSFQIREHSWPCLFHIMLQMGTNIMANQVKKPIQNYFEKVLYENLTFEIPPLWFFKSSRVIKKIATSPCGLTSSSSL